MTSTRRFSQQISRHTGEEQISIEPSPRLSVILCTYNRRDLVLSTLTSLRRQTLSTTLYEVIVIDNGSNDGTFEAVQTYVYSGDARRSSSEHWQVHCYAEPKPGLSQARTMGLGIASGEFLVFLDDDVLADSRFLEYLLRAYDTTGADAIGGKVTLRWEAPRPKWLDDDLLRLLGYFHPASTRVELPDSEHFSSSCFSVKTAALRRAGGFSPLLNTHADRATDMEIAGLCQRLRGVGYHLWYEPHAMVTHCVPDTRLRRAFFLRHSYDYGRAEIHRQYIDCDRDRTLQKFSVQQILKNIVSNTRNALVFALIQRPLLLLSGKSANERLQARMTQARRWGRVVQLIRFLEHIPSYTMNPTVLFVHAGEQNAATHLQLQALRTQRIHCHSNGPHISLVWLWRHRAQHGQTYAIVHFYRPGLFITNYWQYQRYWLLLHLMRQFGLRVVTTDTGGWWYSEPRQRFLPQRTFEHMLCYRSHLVITHARHPDEFYADKTLHRRLCSLPHPGFHQPHTPDVTRAEARHMLGLPTDASFVYLCLASYHTEREVLQLIDAYSALPIHRSASDERAPQLLLIGTPGDKKQAQQFWQRAALNSTIHLFLEVRENELPLYLETVDAVVLPHFAVPTAGILEEALLALSYQRCVIAPKLPRFHDILSETCSIQYDPNSCANLTDAMFRATRQPCQLQIHDLLALEAASGWQAYARRLHHMYKGLLIRA